MIKHFTTAVAAALTLAASAGAHADGGVLKMVVPFAAGGPVDNVARLVASELGPELGGMSVVIENRGGAGGTIGANYVAHAEPDGNTVLVATLGYVLAAGTTPKLPYDPRKDLTPVYLLGQVQSLLVVRNSLPVHNAADLVAWAKAGKPLSYGSSGVGSTMHIGGELFNLATGAKATHVPYRGAAPALVDLMADRVDMVNADVPVLQPYVKDGRVRAIVIYDDHRSPYMPNVPDAKEAKLPELMMSNNYGVLAPAGTPPQKIKQLEAAFDKVIHKPSMQAKFKELGLQGPMKSADFKAKLDADLDRWVPFLQKAGIRTE
jgi:tripartite-type tricarboxylate transporter receptor subunit TctC